MPDLPVTIVLPNGGARRAEIPGDIVMRDILPELVSLLQLPTVGPDGRPMGYRMDSKALGRELGEEETLAEAGVPPEDRLILTADITAGAVSLPESPPPSQPAIGRRTDNARIGQEMKPGFVHAIWKLLWKGFYRIRPAWRAISARLELRKCITTEGFRIHLGQSQKARLS